MSKLRRRTALAAATLIIYKQNEKLKEIKEEQKTACENTSYCPEHRTFGTHYLKA